MFFFCVSFGRFLFSLVDGLLKILSFWWGFIRFSFIICAYTYCVFPFICCRLCSKLLRYHFQQWPFSQGLLHCMVQAFYMQVLQVLSGDGLLYLSSPGLWALQWLRSAPLSQFVTSKLPSLFLMILCVQLLSMQVFS